MAKRRGRPARPAAAQPTAGVGAVLARQMEQIRAQFNQFRDGFAAITERRAELAPRFMRVYGAWVTATGGNFVAFVRVIDPTVPADRDAYRNHASYQAAVYLQRLAGGTRRAAVRPVRSNLTALARTLATIRQVVRDEDTLWRAIETELGFTQRQMTKLRAVVAATQPLLNLPNAHRVNARIVHMREVPAQTADERRAAA